MMHISASGGNTNVSTRNKDASEFLRCTLMHHRETSMSLSAIVIHVDMSGTWQAVATPTPRSIHLSIILYRIIFYCFIVLYYIVFYYYNVLYCVVLYFILLLQCIVLLYCVVLCCVVLCCVVLYCTVLYCILLGSRCLIGSKQCSPQACTGLTCIDGVTGRLYSQQGFSAYLIYVLPVYQYLLLCIHV